MSRQPATGSDRGFAPSDAPARTAMPSFASTADETAAVATSATLARLLCGVAGQDQAAFAELYRLTSATLYTTAILILKRPERAEDVLQSSYMDIWRKAVTFDSSLHAPIDWMIAIVRNLAIGSLRREIAPRSDDVIHARPSDRRTGPELTDESARPAIADCPIKQAGLNNHLVIMAAYLYGENRQQLSDRLGIPVDTVKALIHQALRDIDASPPLSRR